MTIYTKCSLNDYLISGPKHMAFNRSWILHSWKQVLVGSQQFNASMSALSPVEKMVIDPKKKIWKVKTLPKIRMFIWRAVSRTLAVADRLQTRGVLIDMEWKQCNNEIESINHVLFECIPAQDILRIVNFPPSTTPARSLGDNMNIALKLMADCSVPGNL